MMMMMIMTMTIGMIMYDNIFCVCLVQVYNREQNSWYIDIFFKRRHTKLQNLPVSKRNSRYPHLRT